MARAIDSEAAYRFLSEQLVKETGAFSKGVNKGLNIARSAMRNPDAISALRPASREQVNALDLGFDVIDAKTGEYPDLEKIALTEEWAQGLVYCDMDGFAVREDGSLILLDECGNCVSCPAERFEIRLLGGAADGRGCGDASEEIGGAI